MFENLTSTKNPDDIFAEVDKVPVANTPVMPQTPAPAGMRPSAMPLPNITPEHSGAGKAVKKVVVLILVMALLGGGAYAAYQFLAAKKAPADVNNNTPAPKVETPVVNTPATTTDIIASSSTSTLDIPNPVVLDYDKDGLADDEERILGTDPLNIDTDKDALNDYEEVKVYKTNPLLADTDGDSYSDGQEVKGGYNPNGAGKLQ